jgi:segregation and condensation protein A
VLELYREGALAFDQAAALSELRVRWIAGATGAIDDPNVDEEYG